MENIIEVVQKEIENGLLKGLNYNRLVLNKDSFSKTNIMQINHLGVNCEIIEGDDEKNYLMDMSKVKWDGNIIGTPGIRIVEEFFKLSEVLKEVAFLLLIASAL